MAIVGWYDLWLDRHLVFRPVGPGGPPEDSVISWPMDPTDRATAYTLLIEAAALDADAAEVAVLANHFGMDDADALEYVRRELPVVVTGLPGGAWRIYPENQPKTWAADTTVLGALVALARALGYDGTVTFKNLCEGWRATKAEALHDSDSDDDDEDCCPDCGHPYEIAGVDLAKPGEDRTVGRTHLDSPMAFVLDGWTQYRAAVLSGDPAAIAGTRDYLRRALAQCVELL